MNNNSMEKVSKFVLSLDYEDRMNLMFEIWNHVYPKLKKEFRAECIKEIIKAEKELTRLGK